MRKESTRFVHGSYVCICLALLASVLALRLCAPGPAVSGRVSLAQTQLACLDAAADAPLDCVGGPVVLGRTVYTLCGILCCGDEYY